MTSAGSLASDAINVTLTPAGAAVMVTEYMPGDDAGARVINTAAAGTIYLGTTSSVQRSNGVPLPAGSSVQWVHPGQLWAVAGPDATAPLLLVVTSCISSWAPSPETIALATAAQLLATGVPSVLTETVIGTYNLTPGQQALDIDVHGYASLLLTDITGGGPPPTPTIASFWFTEPASGVAQHGYDAMTAEVQAVPARIPVVAGRFNIFNANSPGPLSRSYLLIGSNRAAGTHVEQLGFASTGFHATTGLTVMAAGVGYPLTDPGYGRIFQGPAFCEFIIGSSAAVKGIFHVRYWTGVGALSVNVTDTNETGWHIAAGTGTQILTKMLSLPTVPYTIDFLCSIAGTADVQMSAIPNY